MEDVNQSIDRIKLEREQRRERERYKASLVFSGFVVGNMSGVLLIVAGWSAWDFFRPVPEYERQVQGLSKQYERDGVLGPLEVTSRVTFLERRVERLESFTDTFVESRLRELGVPVDGPPASVPSPPEQEGGR